MTHDEQIDQLIKLYMQMQFDEVVAQATRLTLEHPASFMIWNILAAGQKALGQLLEAETGFRTATLLNPAYAEAYYNLGIVLHDQGKFDAALDAYHSACRINPNHAVACFNIGNTHMEMHAPEKAITAYRRAIDIEPRYSEAHNNLGNALKAQGDLTAALSAYESAIQANPNYATAHKNHAVALTEAGRMDEAISAYIRAIQVDQTDAQSYKAVGRLLQDKGNISDTNFAYRRAVDLNPNDFDAYVLMGNAFRDQKEMEQAISAYRSAIAINPNLADAYNTLGASLADIGRTDEAIAAYEKALAILPNRAEFYNNLGNALNVQCKFSDAILAYKRSIDINPTFSDAYSNMGTALGNIGKVDEEIAAYQRAIEINPNHATSHNNIASALLQIGAHDQAIAAYRRALEINPTDAIAEAQLLHQLQHVCDFGSEGLFEAASARLGLQTEATPPFLAFGWADNPDQQLLRATKWAQSHYPKPQGLRPLRQKGPPERLRVGLFSADIRPHPMMYCLSGILGNYDPASLEIFVYNLYRGQAEDWPQKVAAQVDTYINAAHLSDHDLINCALSHALDIAVDLTGYTAGNRCSALQVRLAPIQINFLGFPGTMGADFMDYIVADPIVIPKDQRQFYSEKVIYLPHSYFPINYAQIDPVPQTRRMDHGLPEDALVFCCFNNTYKIGSREFALWMRLLGKVERGVLWLLKSNPWAEDNLRKAAARANIDPARLIFAEKVPVAKHLERHRHADLFLDTFNYNAHTTACDALWMGVPVVTKIGQQFPARVAASLLTAVGMPELITHSDAEYEATILRLSQDADAIGALKSKLRNAIGVCPLFDAKRFTRNFEQGLRSVYNRARDGQKAEDIWVIDSDPWGAGGSALNPQ